MQSEHLEQDFCRLRSCLKQEITVWWLGSGWGRKQPRFGVHVQPGPREVQAGCQRP